MPRDARAAALRCIFCGWWVVGGRRPVGHAGLIPDFHAAMRALMNHFARYHGRVL